LVISRSCPSVGARVMPPGDAAMERTSPLDTSLPANSGPHLAIPANIDALNVTQRLSGDAG
jgi:hypothetical protein